MKFNITYYLLSKSYHQPFGWMMVAVTVGLKHSIHINRLKITQFTPLLLKSITLSHSYCHYHPTEIVIGKLIFGLLVLAQ